MTWTTIQPNQDARFGAACGYSALGSRDPLQAKKIAKPQAECGQPADSKQVTSVDAIASLPITQSHFRVSCILIYLFEKLFHTVGASMICHKLTARKQTPNKIFQNCP